MLKAGADQDPVVTPEEDITKEVKAKIKEAKEDIKEVKEEIKEVKEEIKEVKAKIKKAEAMYSEEDLSKNPLYISHVNSLASLQSSLASLESRLTRYEARREGLETQAELLKEKNQLTAVPPAGATGGVGSAVAGGAWTGASSFYAPKILTVTIRRCSTSKGLRNGIFRICQDNYAAYCDSADQSFRWITPEHSFAGQRDLFVRVRTMNLRYAVSIQRTIEELCGYRQFEAEFSMEPDLDTSEPIFVSVQHFRSSGISPEYSSTPSVGSSSKVTNVSEEKQLRMIEDPGYSHLRIGGLQQCHLLPRYRYQKYVRHPMNIIFLSAALHGALDSSESRTRSRGRSVAVPTICFSLAKDEFRDEYANRVVTKEYGGVEEEMVEVFLAVLFRVTNHEYMSHMLAMLKTGSVQRGDVLITSVFLRRQYESTKDFEFFVRGNKTYSVNLWRKVSETDQTEYYLQEEDFRDIEDENDEAVVGQETYSP